MVFESVYTLRPVKAHRPMQGGGGPRAPGQHAPKLALIYFLPLGKMSSSLAVGKKEPLQMSSTLTRVLVLKASDT